MATSFGKKQLNNPTPSGISAIIDISSAICGVLVAWVSTASFIPNEVGNIITSILGLMIGITLAIKPFFGIKTTSKMVNIKNVSSMDDEPKTDTNAKS